jgi:hypothetical protein
VAAAVALRFSSTSTENPIARPYPETLLAQIPGIGLEQLAPQIVPFGAVHLTDTRKERGMPDRLVATSPMSETRGRSKRRGALPC